MSFQFKKNKRNRKATFSNELPSKFVKKTSTPQFENWKVVQQVEKCHVASPNDQVDLNDKILILDVEFK